MVVWEEILVWRERVVVEETGDKGVDGGGLGSKEGGKGVRHWSKTQTTGGAVGVLARGSNRCERNNR